jgi:hypothetical protein
MLLSTDIWVGSLIRRAEFGGALPWWRTRATRARGAREGAEPLGRHRQLYSDATRGNGERIWMQPAASTDEGDLDGYVERGAN